MTTGLPLKNCASRTSRPHFVLEHEIERELLADLLVDADLLEDLGLLADSLRALRAGRVLRVRGRGATPSAEREVASSQLAVRLPSCRSPPRRLSAGRRHRGRSGTAGAAGPDLSAPPAGIMRPPLDSPVAATCVPAESVGQLGTDGNAPLQQHLLRLRDRNARDAELLVHPAVAVQVVVLLGAEAAEILPRRLPAAGLGEAWRAPSGPTPSGGDVAGSFLRSYHCSA